MRLYEKKTPIIKYLVNSSLELNALKKRNICTRSNFPFPSSARKPEEVATEFRNIQTKHGFIVKRTILVSRGSNVGQSL